MLYQHYNLHGMVKVKPVKAKKKVHLPSVVEQSETHISQQARIINKLPLQVATHEETVADLNIQFEAQKTEKNKLEAELAKERSNRECKSQRSMEYISFGAVKDIKEEKRKPSNSTIDNLDATQLILIDVIKHQRMN